MRPTTTTLMVLTGFLALATSSPGATAIPPDDCIYDDGHGGKMLCVRLTQAMGSPTNWVPALDSTPVAVMAWYKLCVTTCAPAANDPFVTVPLVALIGQDPCAPFFAQIECEYNPIFPDSLLAEPTLDLGIPLICAADVTLDYDQDADGDPDQHVPLNNIRVPCAMIL